jgi:2-polyprenyl-6-hydroxyphenyl methylase/3-demethylubiquinone-9 3-methyltransferase
MLSLKPASAKVTPCKICQQPSTLFGVVDFNRNCVIPAGVKLPLTGTPVYYRRCNACGFLFTDAFDDWSQDDYKSHIYNAEYLAVDPGYVLTRPRDNAGVVQQVFGMHKMTLRVLDYGGGNDVLCSELRALRPMTPSCLNMPRHRKVSSTLSPASRRSSTCPIR